MLAGALLLAGCGGSSTSQPSHASDPASSASSYPAQYKADYFAANHCGSSEGDSTSNCECQVKYIEAHLPYKDLEEGSSEHARSEEVLNEAPSHCEAHTSSEEAAHNSATEGQQKIQELKEQKEREYQPEEEKLQEDKEKVEYEHGG